MVCPVPAVHLPDDLREQLEKSESGKIDTTNGPGVASLSAFGGRVRADIYIGLILDGFKLYYNISSTDPSIKMQFALPPVIKCQSEVLTFQPDNDFTIVIQVMLYTGKMKTVLFCRSYQNTSST